MTIPPCNLCGCPCGNERDARMGLIDASVVGGYESTPGNGDGALDDLSKYRFSLCEFCLDWLFARCKIPPHVVEVDINYVAKEGREETFRPAAVRVRDDEWRRFKDAFFAESARRSAAREQT